jgi:hypothetical protein
MSTATATPHRFSDPIAIAAAVVCIIGGATVIGVAASQSEYVAPSLPAAPVHGKITVNHPARIGQGDFTRPQQSQQGADTTPLKGGHTTVSEP